MQYLVASEFGSKDWDTFERMFLNKTDRRAETSPINGQLGGRPTIPVTDYAEAFLAENSTKGVPQLRYWNREWWKYDHHWISVNEDDLNNQVTRFLQRHKVQRAYRISTAFVNDVVLNIRGLCCLSGITMPCWLPDGSDASDTLCFSNGLLSVQELIAGNKQTLRSRTPEYFGLDNVDYAYEPDADCPMWNEYLATTFDDDDSRAALQMMFGYILSGKTNKNVGFFLVGRGGDGKSVAAHILRKLIGENQSCCLPFANLGDRFSSYLLTEHKLNLVEEMPVSAEIRNISDAEKVFKMVTDGAVIPVEQKFRAPRDKRAKARCVFLANELPQFVDRSNGLWDRLIVLPFTHRFRDTDAEKADLKHDLEAELPGIFNWAICGARMLEKHTRFPIPPASVEYLAKHRLACDHEAAFLSEAVVADPDAISSKQLLYQQYRSWIESRGYKPVGSSRFNAAVKAAFPDVREERQRSPIDRLIWSGISLLNMA